MFYLTSQPFLFSKSLRTKTHPSHISNIRFYIPTKKLTLHVINLPYQSRNHTEHAVPENPEPIVYLVYHHKIYLFANFPGSQIALSYDRHRYIPKKFCEYKYLLMSYLSVLCILTKTGGVLDILIRVSFSFTKYSIEQISKKITRIVSCPKFPAIFLHFLS